MHRFFVNPENLSESEEIIISGEDVYHITRSLRLKPGEKVTISTGDGLDYLVELVEFTEGNVLCRKVKSYPSRGEPKMDVTLYQGLPKSDKLDLIVQKCTELGIRRVIPVEMSRSIVKLTDKKADRRQERWQKIAEEAAKQSGRGQIPEVGPFLTWKEFLKSLAKENYDLFIIPWEQAQDHSLRQVLQAKKVTQDNIKRIAYLIGPEGGIADEEVQALLTFKAELVTLGPRILRTETAGFTVLTILMYEFLEMEGCDQK